METKYYRVKRIDGDYAILVRTDLTDDDTLLLARALLPLGIDEGTDLVWENLEYHIIE